MAAPSSSPPKIERRPSGYFVFFNGGIILLPENGSAATVRPNTLGNSNIYLTLYTRAGATVVAGPDQLRTLDDQGNIVMTSAATDSNAGFFTALTEDAQGSIIGVQQKANVTAPGQGAYYTMSMQRISSTMQLQGNTPQVSLGSAVTFGGMEFALTTDAAGNYILAGATYTAAGSSGNPQLTLASVPAYAPLAARARATAAGTLGLYPNPGLTQQTVTVRLPAAGSLAIYDLLGRPTSPAQAVTGAAATLTLPPLAAGVYLVRLTGHDGRIWTDRLTVQ